MEEVTNASARRRPGRVRSPEATNAILDAAMELLLEGGLASFSIEGIARRAGVSKQTIYRWWPSRGAVALDAFLTRVEPLVPFPEDDDFSKVLHEQILSVVRIFREGPIGELIKALIGEAQTDPDLAQAFRERWLLSRRIAGRKVFEEAQASGQIRADLQIETAIDLFYGPVYFRLLAGHEPLSDEFAADITQYGLAGLAPR